MIQEVAGKHIPMNYDLEERLIKFASSIIDVTENLPNTSANLHLAGQLLRSGTAPALMYGEAQAAESRKDFIHKMKVALKELRESSINLKILHSRNIHVESLQVILKENLELITIFVKSIKTASSS